MKVAAIVLGLLLSVTIAMPAHADPGINTSIGSRPGVTPKSRCVTPSEFQAVKNRMTRKQVESILDWDGRTLSRRDGVNTWGARKYRGCGSGLRSDGAMRDLIVIAYYRKGLLADISWLVVIVDDPGTIPTA